MFTFGRSTSQDAETCVSLAFLELFHSGLFGYSTRRDISIGKAQGQKYARMRQLQGHPIHGLR